MRCKALLCSLFVLALAGAAPARAAGTTPLALQTQFDNSGNLLSGCLLYFYQAGTVATPQQVFSDFGLTQVAPNPLSCSAGGRVPQHWLADGLIHIRLTDQQGLAVLDTTLQTLGPSSGGGGGGGGGGVDPTAVALTGDIKYRMTSEVQPGWVILNATTIGSALSGATQRANSDTQALFVHLWTNCPDAHCAVLGGRGAAALADFNANKQITLPDLRDRALVGRDCMGVGCAGGILASNVSSGGGDGPDTAGASGGSANQTASATFSIAVANLPNYNLTIPAGQGAHTHSTTLAYFGNAGGSGVLQAGSSFPFNASSSSMTTNGLPAMFAQSGGSNSPITTTSASFANMQPFVLGTYYQKL